METSRHTFTKTVSLLLLAAALLLVGCGRSDNAEVGASEMPDYLINTRQFYPFDAGYELVAAVVCGDGVLAVGQIGEDALARFYALDASGENGAELTLVSQCHQLKE